MAVWCDSGPLHFAGGSRTGPAPTWATWLDNQLAFCWCVVRRPFLTGVVVGAVGVTAVFALTAELHDRAVHGGTDASVAAHDRLHEYVAAREFSSFGEGEHR